jgi:hypothetical protein
MDPRIGDFISKNRKKYTREAITQQLIEAGHDPADVDATWAALDTPDPDEAGLAGEGFWSRFFLFLVGLNVGVFLLVGLTTGMFQNLAGGGGVLAGVFAVALGIGALIAWGIVAAVGPDKMGRTTATIIGAVIPLVFALLIGGSCFALAGAIGPPPLPQVNGEMELQFDEPFALEATGAATCQPYRETTNYSVYGTNLGQIDGNSVYVSIDAYDIEPGTKEILLTVGAEGELSGQFWSNNADSQLEADVAPDGLSGTMTFAALFPAEGPTGPDGDTLSGTITWNCEAP